MIKVNLLPYREAQKKEKIWQQIVFLLCLIGGGIVLVVGFGFTISGYEKAIIKQKDDINEEIAGLEKKLGQIDKIKAQKAEIERKIQVIDMLNKNRMTTSTLLFKIAENVPEKVWLLSIQDRDKDVVLDGEAITGNDVSDFMERLSKAGLFSKITLITLDQSNRGEMKIMRFNLNLTKV